MKRMDQWQRKINWHKRRGTLTLVKPAKALRFLRTLLPKKKAPKPSPIITEDEIAAMKAQLTLLKESNRRTLDLIQMLLKEADKETKRHNK